MKNKHKQ